MTISIKDWSKIDFPQFSYVDDSFTVNTTRNLFEQGITTTRAVGLDKLNGQTINSYNSFYLSTRKKLSDVFTFEQISSELTSITTPIVFTDSSANKYLKFSPGSYLLDTSEDTDTGKTRFQLVFDSYRNLIVKHVSDNTEYRLCFDPDGTIYFATTSVSSNYLLGYLITDTGYLVLYSTTSEPHKVLTYNNSTLSLSPISAEGVQGSKKLINILYNFTNLDYDIDNSWVSYDLSNINLANINNEKSAYSLDGQYLLTTTYSDIHKGVNINFLNLKTNVSESDQIKRGSILYSGPNETPSVDYRFYTSINTGNDQEKGNDNIVLTYTFYDKDIPVPAGTDTYFSTPSSIYPYSKLNINDTKFVANGAYGSFAPNVSDRIKKLRKDSSSFNNGRYLCTWLSGNGNGDGFKWVDRYYYPDLIEKETAYTEPLFNPSFDDPIDDIAYATLNRQRIDNSPIFDKASDLFLEPNTKYAYERVSKDDFVSYFQTLSDNVVYTQLPARTLNGEQTDVINIDKINKTGRFSISTDIYLKPNTSIGYCLLGNLTNFGFSILNDTFATPVLVTMQDNTIYCYNTDQILVSRKQFDKNVKDIIRFDGLDNFIIVCEDGYVYNVKYDSTVDRLHIIPELSSYLSYTPYEDKVAFVLDTSGNCLVVDNLTLSTSLSTAENTSTGNITSVFYHISALKGVDGTDMKKYDIKNMSYLSNNTIYKIKSDTGDAVPVIQSSSTLIDYAIDRNGNYLFLHNSNQISLYNKNRVKVFTQSLSSIPLTGNKCEFIREHVKGSVNEYIAVVGIDDKQKCRIGTLDYSGNVQGSTIVSGNLSSTKTNFTNYNYYIGTNHSNTLRFKIRLRNIKNYEDVLTETITYDYSKLAEGIVNLGYMFDSVSGKITFSVNGIPQQHIVFDATKYTVEDLFYDNIKLGTAGFYNGQSLSDYLKQQTHYNTFNTTIQNLIVLNKALNPREMGAIGLIGGSVDQITISIPCGQRSNIEEIIRTFKFGVPDSYSNHIKIEVKNSGIVDAELQSTLKANITSVLSESVKGDVVVDDISFVEYIPSA